MTVINYCLFFAEKEYEGFFLFFFLFFCFIIIWYVASIVFWLHWIKFCGQLFLRDIYMNWLWNVLSVFDEWIRNRKGRNCYNYFYKNILKNESLHWWFLTWKWYPWMSMFLFIIITIYPFYINLLVLKRRFRACIYGYICDYLHFYCNNLRYIFINWIVRVNVFFKHIDIVQELSFL